MESRNTAYDQDYTKYANYMALIVDRAKAWFSIKKDGVVDNLSYLTEVVETETGLGLESEVITTYWLSYDRDNMAQCESQRRAALKNAANKNQLC